jgi:hypothetical protein
MNTEDGTDLCSEELMLYEVDLIYGREVNRGSLDRISSYTKPRTVYGCMG